MTKAIGDRRVELVKPERTPATDEERREADEAMAEARRTVSDILEG